MYRLEGWDKDWIYSNHLNEVHYKRLPPNEYKFQVKAANQSGTWNKTPYEIVIIINPPFWKTLWFYSAVLLSFIATIIFITRGLAQRKLKQRIAELENQRALDKERQRISREMHDDIGAGLTQIVLMSESAKMKVKITNSKGLSDIADTSRTLVSNMSEIIWSLNPENKTLDQLISYLREHLGKQLEYSDINYVLELPEVMGEILLSNEQTRNLLLITKETVNNAIKHSGAKNIFIKLTYQPGILLIEVKDDGIGFDTQKKNTGNGLRNIRQRVEQIGGEVMMESGTGKGSRFVYTIPINTTKLTF
jgi:signal transduction histidine kinase